MIYLKYFEALINKHSLDQFKKVKSMLPYQPKFKKMANQLETGLTKLNVVTYEDFINTNFKPNQNTKKSK
jgi:hypothetical protein